MRLKIMTGISTITSIIYDITPTCTDELEEEIFIIRIAINRLNYTFTVICKQSANSHQNIWILI
jgi:hypothetical protein